MGKQNDTLMKNIEEYDKSKQKLDRNTIIITALANYYDYNDLSQEEGREVVKIIMDLQKNNRHE
jgi:flagellar biosynthesis/type III secretory pathway chaperone|tara:strand:+ start:158 stop:349 length:192 start_codon:yes stop_codon:yes gene_type:complete